MYLGNPLAIPTHYTIKTQMMSNIGTEIFTIPESGISTEVRINIRSFSLTIINEIQRSLNVFGRT